MREFEIAFMHLVFSGSIALIIVVVSKIKKPSHICALTEEGARFEVETNRDFLIFYAVLIFTCVVGITELLPSFDQCVIKGFWERILLSLLYYGLLVGIVFSISRCWAIYRENHDVTFSGKLGYGIKEYIEHNGTILDRKICGKYSLLDRGFQAFAMIFIAFFFELLYFAKIGWLQ